MCWPGLSRRRRGRPRRCRRGARPIRSSLPSGRSVQASDDPAEYGEYLRQYPEGAFAALARARLEKPAAKDPSVELAFWEIDQGLR